MADGGQRRDVGEARIHEHCPSCRAPETQDGDSFAIGSESDAGRQDFHRRGDEAEDHRHEAQDGGQVVGRHEEPQHGRCEEAGVACSQDRQENDEEIELS